MQTVSNSKIVSPIVNPKFMRILNRAVVWNVSSSILGDKTKLFKEQLLIGRLKLEDAWSPEETTGLLKSL